MGVGESSNKPAPGDENRLKTKSKKDLINPNTNRKQYTVTQMIWFEVQWSQAPPYLLAPPLQGDVGLPGEAGGPGPKGEKVNSAMSPIQFVKKWTDELKLVPFASWCRLQFVISL